MGRKRSIASREYQSGTPGRIIRPANGSIMRRAASDYFLSQPPSFFREAILQQCEASYTPRCNSEHTPEHEVLDTPLTPLRDLPIHRRMALDHECLNELKFHGLSG
mgnify:CR=1 FL=1